MDRYLDRHVTSQGLLLRNVPPNATEAVWLYQIERHYRKVDGSRRTRGSGNLRTGDNLARELHE